VCSSWQYLQLKELGGLVQTPVVAGEGDRLLGGDVQFMGGSQLHTVVAPEREAIRKTPSRFYELLADFDNGER